MNNENLKNETEFLRFLLGEMTEEERIEFEGNFILDVNLFEYLRVVEDELIENYVCETLNVSERSKFETNYLKSKKHREKVEFTRQMLDRLKEERVAVAEVKKTTLVVGNPSFFESITAFFNQPGLAIGVILGILLLVFGGWFLFRTKNQPIEIVKNSPTPTSSNLAKKSSPIVENTNNPPINTVVNSSNINTESTNQRLKTEANTNKNSTNTNSEKPPKMPSSIVTTLALFAGGVRSDGKTNELNLPKNSGGANLQLNLESSDYKIYRADIIDQNGNAIYRSGKLFAKSSKINIFIPAKNLKKGDYILKLYGKNAKNENDSVADFQFRVNLQ